MSSSTRMWVADTWLSVDLVQVQARGDGEEEWPKTAKASHPHRATAGTGEREEMEALSLQILLV